MDLSHNDVKRGKLMLRGIRLAPHFPEPIKFRVTSRIRI